MARFLFYDDKLINLLLEEEKPSGGAAVQALGWIQGLSEKGQEVYVMTDPASPGAIKPACRHIRLVPGFDQKKGIRWIRWVYYRLPHLYRQIRHVRPDYLYQGIPGWTSFLLGLICQQLHIKYVLRVSNDFLVDERFYQNYSRTHRFFQNLGFQLSDAILCQNEYQLKRIRQAYPRKEAYKISNPVYLNTAGAGDSAPTKKYIAWLGLFQYQKNLPLLYEIAQLLPGETFLVAGKELAKADAQTHEYQDKLRQLPNVQFAGFLQRDQVLPFLAGARYLLNTSHYEGFSNTFLEAMSVGTPILSSEKVNPDGILSAHRLGIVYRDAADLQSQLSGMSPQDYQHLSDNVRHYVTEHHHYTTLAGRLMNLLHAN
ncbi:MAG: glycosyltransferase family 4 protein [Adhaeribacter sp.]